MQLNDLDIGAVTDASYLTLKDLETTVQEYTINEVKLKLQERIREI